MAILGSASFKFVSLVVVLLKLASFVFRLSWVEIDAAGVASVGVLP